MSRYNDYYGFAPYVPVAERRAKARREAEKMGKKGKQLSPVVIEGRQIAATFWGKAWCDNVESYRDYENRLPRGRAYVRNGSVINLQIARGKVTALVSGSSLYKIEIAIAELPKNQWETLKRACAGQIGSLIELIQGKLSKNVLEIITRKDGGLFPKPAEITMDCSCPDWAGLCKHLAAVLYGVGAKLDSNPELFFLLRGVDHHELVAADVSAITGGGAAAGVATLEESSLASVFGIELDGAEEAAKPAAKPVAKKPAKATVKTKPEKPAKNTVDTKTNPKSKKTTEKTRKAKSKPKAKAKAKRAGKNAR